MSRLLIPITFVVAALVAACSGTGASPAPTAPAVTLPAATVAPASAAASGPTVSVSSAGYFVGPNGMTLYAFDKDAANKSNCQTGQCATNWPALAPAASGITVGAGLSASDFASISRDDGSMQVTFKSVPLYFFAGDQKPGDKNGDGVGGIWHVATVNTTVPAASSAPSSAPSAATSTAPSSAPASSSAQECTDPKTYEVIPCPSSSPAAGGGSTVAVAAGGFLVGPNGNTLYVFDKDKTPGSSACSGDCSTNWIALVVPAGSTLTPGDGVDSEDLSTFARDDGSMQVAYYGKPLYYFAGDSAAGQTNGDGVAGLWHEAKPQ